jgi:7-cyano-7-deazaguanine synthase
MPDRCMDHDRAVAVLASGGIDSAILCVDLLGQFHRVYPLYVRFGLRWEDVEVMGLSRFLDAAARSGLMPLHVLEEPVTDVYGSGHWSTGGADVPGAETDDTAVFLPGRNLLLAVKAAVWCQLRSIEALALGCLRANPFPDSTPEFFKNLETVINQALSSRLQLLRPFERLGKDEVLRRGAGLPLHHTVSCLRPTGGQHCGACNKCAERRRGFRAAGLSDLTRYASHGAAVL